MSFTRIQSNPRYEEFREIVATHRDWLGPWEGMFFRYQTVEFPSAKDILSGDGARRRGGRWNVPGTLAVYGSVTDAVALEESKATDRYYGVVTKAPRLVVAIEAQLAGVIDLTDARVRRSFGVSLKELAAEDWRKLLEAGKESLSQALGRACATIGASGILARSAAVPSGINVVVFQAGLRGDQLAVVEGDKLDFLKKRGQS